jgi:hypothetical protein
MVEPPRSREQRKLDTLRQLEQEVDAWIATASPESGEPYLVPLSFLWEGSTLLLSTNAVNQTAQNLRASGTVRIGIGPTRDVILLEGTVKTVAVAEISQELGDAFAAKTGFDPRSLKGTYLYFRVQPEVIQVWREANELAGRYVMRDGSWL